MVEVDVGAHCSLVDCHRLDFLPFVCHGCGNVFCKEHRSKEVHGCSQALVVAQPGLGGRGSSSTDGGGGDDLCVSCDRRVLVPVTCSSCSRHFCVQHRLPEDHGCPALLAAASAPSTRSLAAARCVSSSAASDHSIAHKASATGTKPARPVKESPLAAKVALMKLKTSAVGNASVPESERVYLNVCLPADSIATVKKGFFFSCTSTVGRVVDDIAKMQGLKNSNNLPSAKKLCLLDSSGGQPFSMDTTLQSLLSSASLTNGGQVSLDYQP